MPVQLTEGQIQALLSERKPFYDFHIHTATERYQASGLREDSFAESSDRFSDIDGAVRCLLNDCGFDVPPDKQGKLFQGAR